MQTPSAFLTIVESLDVISILVVNTRSGLLLLQVLLNIVYTDVGTQVETGSILTIELESSTVGIGQSLLRRVPNVDTRSLGVNSCTVLYLVDSPTFLVTETLIATLVLGIVRTTQEVIDLRLNVHGLLVPDQTLKLNVSRNNQSIVRSDHIVTLCLVHLQSYSVVAVVLVVLVTGLAIPAAIVGISLIGLVAGEGLVAGALVSGIAYVAVSIAVRVDGLVCGPGSQLVGVGNLDTYIQDTRTILTECYRSGLVLGSVAPCTLSIVVTTLLGVVIERIEGLGRCYAQGRSSCTSVVVNNIRLQNVERRSVGCIVDSSA